MSREYYKQQNEGKAVSFSRLNTFNHCQYEYYLTYVCKLPRTDNIWGKIGGKTHDLCESLQRCEISNEVALKEFLEEIDECKMFNVKFPSEKIEKNFIECISHFFKNYKPIKCDKFEIEKGFDVYVGKLNTLLLGYIDIIIFINEDEIYIYDYKTSSKFSKSDLEDKKLQLIAYAIGCIKQYNLKPKKLAFNMLKYCEITWIENNKEKSTVCERNVIGAKIKTPAKRILKKIGLDDLDIEFKLNQMEENNEICEELKTVFKIEDYYLEVELNDKEIQEFENYVDKTMIKINSKMKSEDFKPVYITESSSFYCTNLCSQRLNCKYFKYYLDKNLNNLKQSETYDELDDLL